MITPNEIYEAVLKDVEEKYDEQLKQLSDKLIENACRGVYHVKDYRFTLLHNDIIPLGDMLKKKGYKFFKEEQWYRYTAEIYAQEPKNVDILFSIRWEKPEI